MGRIIAILFSLTLFSGPIFAAETGPSMYKCQTKAGAVLFTDQPCMGQHVALLETLSDKQLQQFSVFAALDTASATQPPPPVSGHTPPVPLTINQAIAQASRYSVWMMSYFAALPLLAGFLSLFVNKHALNYVLRYSLASLVYLSVIPGTFAAVLTAYALFFTRQNLLNVNWMVYFLPPLSMILTLTLIGRVIHSFEQLPGVGRLSGFVLLITLIFGLLLILFKTHFLIGFFGSILELALIAVVVFLALKWAMAKLI